jgi:hypothetical protein
MTELPTYHQWLKDGKHLPAFMLDFDALTFAVHPDHLKLMRRFLQILVVFGEIPSGKYFRESTWSKWQKGTK